MRLPTSRFKIAPLEYALLKPGLDILAIRLATARMGSFPFRHPWHRIDFIKSNVQRNQAFDEGMAERIISVRRKVFNLELTRKIRLDPFEIAAAQLALRLYKQRSADPSSQGEAQRLARKLEMLRKRAMRATIADLGRSAYSAEADRWKKFLAWCRYHLLHSQTRGVTVSRGHPFLRAHWGDQRSRLTEMVESAISQHPLASTSTEKTSRLVRLLKEGLRRGRHPLTLRELLSDEGGEGLDLVLKLVTKKLGLPPLTNGALPGCVTASERAEKFRIRHKKRVNSKNGLPTDDNGEDSAFPSVPFEPSVLLSSVQAATNEQLAEAVALWFEFYVERELWNPVGSFALTETDNYSPKTVTVPLAPSLGELIWMTRPRELDLPTLTPFARVTYVGCWSLTWLHAFGRSYSLVAAILREGYRRRASALASPRLPDNQMEQ